jgi:hypothetical protein
MFHFVGYFTNQKIVTIVQDTGNKNQKINLNENKPHPIIFNLEINQITVQP